MALVYISTQVSKQSLNWLGSGANGSAARLSWRGGRGVRGSGLLTDLSL